MSARLRIASFAALATVLSATALVPLYTSVPWFWPMVATVVAVAACGELARRARAPGPLVVLTGLAGLTLILTYGWARGVAPLGLVPGPGAVEVLRRLVHEGLADAERLAAPVPPTPALRLLAVAGVGLVALVVDAVAVTWRRPALAGLPLLALFAVPATVLPDGLGVLPFLLTAAGYLALLFADQRERLGRWGRPLGLGRTGSGSEEAMTAPLAAVGRRVGAVAVGLALAVPSLLPGLRAGWLSGGGAGPGGRGGSTIVVVNPIVNLKRDLTLPEAVEVLRYRTADRNPDYLRMVTLDAFDGISWRQSRVSAEAYQRVAKGLPPPPGLDPSVPTTKITTSVRVSRLDVPWLPLPYPATAVRVPGDWRYDRTTRVVFSTRSRTRGLGYTVVSRKLRPLRETLDGAPPARGVDRYLQLPAGLPQVVPELAARVTAGAATPYRRAVTLQEWFRTEFAYDLSVAPGNGGDALLTFLDDRRGYCEQFAATMAVMARTLGIPARVAVGFTPGVRRPDGSWSVTSRDAHAWPELFFPGVGWSRFEPTPLGDGRASVPAYSTPTYGTDPAAPDAAAPSAPPSPAPNRRLDRLSDNLRDTTPSGEQTGRAGDFPVLPVAAAALVVVLATPSAVDLLRRRRRWSRSREPIAAVRAGWDEVCRAAADVGFAACAADSPRAAAQRLAGGAGLSGDDAAALTRLARGEELARYARALPVDAATGARADAARVRAALIRRVPWWRRWVIRAFPPSVLGEARQVVGWVGDGLNAADRAAATARERLSRLAASRRRAI